MQGKAGKARQARQAIILAGGTELYCTGGKLLHGKPLFILGNLIHFLAFPIHFWRVLFVFWAISFIFCPFPFIFASQAFIYFILGQLIHIWQVKTFFVKQIIYLFCPVLFIFSASRIICVKHYIIYFTPSYLCLHVHIKKAAPN